MIMLRGRIQLGTTNGLLQARRNNGAGAPYQKNSVFVPQVSRDWSGRGSSYPSKPSVDVLFQLPASACTPEHGGWELRCFSHSISSLVDLSGGSAVGLAVSAAAGTYGLVAHLHWRQHQQQLVQSGACAAAADILTLSSSRHEGISNSPTRSKIYKASRGSTEYVYLTNPWSHEADGLAIAPATGGGDALLFFHGGLCGSDQLLASGLHFPPIIGHLLLPNRQGYLRSDPPPLWDESQQFQIRSRRRQSAFIEKGGSVSGSEWVRLCRRRMWQQATLFNDLVRHVVLPDQHQVSRDSTEAGKLHLLGVGLGSAHAIAYAHFFPQRVKSISLLAPVLELQPHTVDGPLESHILARVRVYRQLVQRFPWSASRLRVPPPKISFLEWLASSASRLAPTTALTVLLHAICHRNITACPSAQQLLAQLQLQQLQQPLLQQPSERERSSDGPNGSWKSTFWLMQQQEAWEAEQQLYRQLLRRVQHATGTCCVTQRLPGFLEDVLLLTPWHGAENEAKAWLLECLAGLQVPGLVVHAGSHNSTLEIKRCLSQPRQELIEFVELPGAHPQTMLLTHGAQLSSALQTLYVRCVSTPPVAGR